MGIFALGTGQRDFLVQILLGEGNQVGNWTVPPPLEDVV